MNERFRIKNDGWDLIEPVDSGLIESTVKKNTREGAERLMLAVLVDAIEYFQQYLFAENDKGKKLFHEAEEWILDKDRDWLYSFENICEVLQLNPDYIRQGLLCWKEAKRRAPSKARISGRKKKKKKKKSALA